MPIHYLAGDILSNEHQAQAFAIASNCEGEINLQTMIPFRDRFPDMYLDFQRRCVGDEDTLNIGDVYVYTTRDNMVIFNLALYRNRYLVMAGQRTVEEAFKQLRALAEEHQVTSIAMPPLGAGTGYIDWTRAKRSLERTFRDWEGDIYVYIKGAIREDMRHWDEAEVDEDAPVAIPRGWQPAMTLYTPEARRAEKRQREGQRQDKDSDGNKKGRGGRKRSGGGRNRSNRNRGSRGGRNRGNSGNSGNSGKGGNSGNSGNNSA